MTQRFASFFITLVLVATAFGWASANPASAHPPTCISNPDRGEAECVHDESEHGDDDDSSSAGPDHEALWLAFRCDQDRDYQPGYTVQFDVQNQIPEDQYEALNANPDDPAYRYLEDGIDYYWAIRRCDYPGSPAGGVWVIVSGPELNAGPDPFALRTEALAQVVLPDLDVQTNPPHSTPDRFGVVWIPTWFWMDEANFDPITETASDPAGTMTVSVTATPLYATWNPGDGTPPIQCFDAGIEWVRGIAEDASDCTHTYSKASVGQPNNQYTIAVELEWEYTWAIDGVDQGPFGGTTTADSFGYAVGEIQAVGS
jgi:hypothetical protein